MLYGEGLGWWVRYIMYGYESIGYTILPKVNILRRRTTHEDVESPGIEEEKTNKYKQKTRSIISLSLQASKPMPLGSDQNTACLAIAKASRCFGN